MFYYSSYVDFSLALTHTHLLASPVWGLRVLVGLLWSLVFISQSSVGILVLRQRNRDDILGLSGARRTDCWGQAWRLLVYFVTFLLAPAVLMGRHAFMASRIRAVNKKLDAICQQGNITCDQFSALVHLHEEQARLVARQRHLGRLLAHSYRMYVTLKAMPQVECQWLIVYLAGTTFPFPALVTTLASRLGITEPGILYVAYLLATFSYKGYRASVIGREDTVNRWPGHCLIYLQQLLEVWNGLLCNYVFWAIFFGLAEHWQPLKDVVLPIVIAYPLFFDIGLWNVSNVEEGSSSEPDQSPRRHHMCLMTKIFPDVVFRHEIVQHLHHIYHLIGNFWHRKTAAVDPQDWAAKGWKDKRTTNNITRQHFHQALRAARRELWITQGSDLLMETVQWWVWGFFRHYYLPAAAARELVSPSPAWLVLLTLGQLVLFELYNQCGHPWSRLVQGTLQQDIRNIFSSV